MGSYGWSFGLERLQGVRAGSAEELQHAVFDFLFRDWNEWLDSNRELARKASTYFGDTVTVKVDEVDGTPHEATIWFDLGADWPVDLVSHWVDVSFAVGRIS